MTRRPRDGTPVRAGIGAGGRGGTDVLRRLLAISPPPWPQLAVAVLLGAAGAAATIGLLAGSGYLVDRAAFRPGLGAIAGILAIVELMAILRAPLRYRERLVGHDAAFRALTGWRVWLYDRLEPLAPAGLRAWRSGDLLTRATDDVDALQDLYLRGLAPLAVAVVSSTLAIVVVALLVPWAALLLGGTLAVALVGPAVVGLAGGAMGERQAQLRGELSAEVLDAVQGAPEVLAFNREGAVLDRIEQVDTELARLSRRRALLAGLSSSITTVCVGIAVVGLLALGVDALERGHLEPAMLAVLPLVAIGAFDAVPPVTAAAARLRDVSASGRRLLALSDIPVPVTDPSRPEPLPEGCPGVELRDLCLRYGDDLPWALDGLTLDLAPGAGLAVVGSSGAGKTSLVNVLLRFWPLQSGRALLGGVAIERLAQADVRRAVALVDQDARLFTGTIRDNVTLPRPDAGDDDLAEVIRRSQLREWVDSLPLGLDTPVGEGGARVSGGQRQRIALARALLAAAPVLLLDEPTAGLDEATATRLLADVLGGSDGRSVLLVTHRQADVAGFDQVAVLDAGRVVALGPGPP